jgi:endo-1,4-beta-xylanase
MNEYCQKIHLPGGWFNYSSYVQAEKMNTDVLMKPLTQNLIILKDINGSAYLNEWGFDGIGNLDVKKSYQIKTEKPDILKICGTRIPLNEKKITLTSGWNLVPYILDNPTTTDQFLEQLVNDDNLIIMKDYRGKAFLPSLNFDAIGRVNPGQGYYLKVNDTDTLYSGMNDLEKSITYDATIRLKDIASFPIGMSLQSKNIVKETKYSKTLKKDFNSLSAEYEMKMNPIYKGPNQFDFSGGDAIVSFAKKNGFRVHGHALIWHEATPIWLNNFNGSDQEFEDLVKTYIKTTVTHFAQEKTIINDQEISVVASWDVVNEAFTSGAENGVFKTRLGEDYLAKCFTWAREADPDVKLFYNDYNLEFDYNKVNQVTNMIDDFRANGIPIDGVGLQAHINISYPPIATFQSCLDLLLEKDVLIHFSEIDMTINREGDITELTYERALSQENRYKEIAELYRNIPAEKRFGITFWGMRDVESWLLNFHNNQYEYPLLFDSNFNFKIAHRGVIEGLH